MTHTEPTVPTASAVRRLALRIAERYNLPTPAVVELSATGVVTFRVKSPADVDRWAAWLGVRTYDGTWTYATNDISAQPAVAGLGLTVYAQIGA